MNLVGKPYQFNDYKGYVTRFVTSGSFKGCYEVKIKHQLTNEVCHWWFKKDVLERQYADVTHPLNWLPEVEQ